MHVCPTASHHERDRTEQWEGGPFRLVVKRCRGPVVRMGETRLGLDGLKGRGKSWL